MKWSFLPLLLMFAFCKDAHQQEQMIPAVSDAKPVILLELFTSEGCSSCPSADMLLPELVQSEKAEVIALSYHVDYWNYLGWKDPFSRKEFSDRQYAYGRHFRLSSVYTPQLVINGGYELVGSNKSKAVSLISKLSEQKAQVSLTIPSVAEEKQHLIIKYALAGKFSSTDHLYSALVKEKDAVKIGAGENNGKLLTHTNIVFQLADHTPLQTGELSLAIPEGLKKENRKLILFLQQKNSYEVTAVAQEVF